MWRLIIYRKAQPPPGQEKNMLHARLPKSLKERLELLQRRRRPTLPLIAHEDLPRDMSPLASGVTSGTGISSLHVTASNNRTPNDNEISGLKEVSPIDTTSMNAFAFVDPTTQNGTGLRDPAEEKITHENYETKSTLDIEILEPDAHEIDVPKPEAVSTKAASPDVVSPDIAAAEVSVPDIEAELGPEPPDSEVETSGDEASDDEISDEISDDETVEEETHKTSQKKSKQHEKEDPVVVALRMEKWKTIIKNRPILKALGKREAERRERKEKKYARPSKWYYNLVGECYIDGMMNGEAIALQNRNVTRKKMHEREFELR
jgi:hypothetical protein